MKSLYIIVLTLVLVNASFAQITISIQPDALAGKDAQIWSGDPATNMGNWPELKANSWTFGGNWEKQRALIQFDLSQIPSDATIISSTLYLFGNYNSVTEINSSQGGSNAGLLQKITEPWDEESVTWNNQPSTTTSGQINISQSTSDYQDYALNVTALIQDMVSNPADANGFMIRLATETDYRRLVFSSSDNTDADLRPNLAITYTLPADSCWIGVIAPDGKDAELWSVSSSTNYGNWPELKINSWTFSGDAGLQRAIFDFDLSDIPSNASLVSAELSLFGNVGSATEVHSTQSGSNSAYVRRITQPWDESNVTWDSQPQTTTQNQDTLPASATAYEDYINLDVTALVDDMLNDAANSHGFMIQLIDESQFRRLVFKSGDGGDVTRYPKLQICYNVPATIKTTAGKTMSVTCSPIPFSDEVTVHIDEKKGLTKIVEIYDLLGRSLYSKNIVAGISKVTINTKDLYNGVYTICVKSSDCVESIKVLKSN